jgi:hypothetical protein
MGWGEADVRRARCGGERTVAHHPLSSIAQARRPPIPTPICTAVAPPAPRAPRTKRPLQILLQFLVHPLPLGPCACHSAFRCRLEMSEIGCDERRGSGRLAMAHPLPPRSTISCWGGRSMPAPVSQVVLEPWLLLEPALGCLVGRVLNPVVRRRLCGVVSRRLGLGGPRPRRRRMWLSSLLGLDCATGDMFSGVAGAGMV